MGWRIKVLKENIYDNFDDFYSDLVNYILSPKGVDVKENAGVRIKIL